MREEYFNILITAMKVFFDNLPNKPNILRGSFGYWSSRARLIFYLHIPSTKELYSSSDSGVG